MGDVARPDDVNALELCPAGQVFKCQVRAGGAGKVRVDVEIGDESHGLLSLRLLHRLTASCDAGKTTA